MITVSIKGNKKNATREGSRRGVSIRQCVKKEKFGTVICKAPCRDLMKVMHWYGEYERTRQGRGFSPGKLIFFSNKDCERSLGRRRKRR